MYGIDIQVKWLPYKDLDSSSSVGDIKESLILRASKTVLVCFDKAERHLPDRCLRQFGMLQPVPMDVPRWERKIRALDQGSDLSKETDLQLKGKNQAELREWLERRLRIVQVEEVVDEIKYMEWYERITRKFVGRPESLESEFQRIVSLCVIGQLMLSLSVIKNKFEVYVTTLCYRLLL